MDYRIEVVTLPVSDVDASLAFYRSLGFSVDVDYHPRIGRSKVTGNARGYLTAIRDARAALAS